MNRLWPGPSLVLFGATALVILQTQGCVALNAVEVNSVAKGITVLIAGQNPGSGVIIKREGNLYTVLTARHVVATEDEYDIVTATGQQYRLDYKTVRKLPGADLALLQFNSSQTYPVANLGDSSTASEGTTIYVAGFPAPTAAITQSVYNFTEGKVTANSTRPLAEGYALVYSNNTLPGMSGGPVLNGQAQVIGVHGRADTTTAGQQQTANPDIVVKTGFNLGIPINTFLTLAAQSQMNLGFQVPNPPSQTPQLRADDYYLRGGEKFNNRDFRGAIADYDQAIRLNPNYVFAYNDRALARANLGELSEARADLDQVIRLNPNQAEAFNSRAAIRRRLGDLQGAIADYDQALRLNPNFALAYNNRGIARQSLGDRSAALADYDQAIRLDPKLALAYNNRGFLRDQQGDLRAAIADYERAMQVNPQFSLAYNNRGFARARLGDLRGAVSDYEQAIRLDPNYAEAYSNRGVARGTLGDKAGELADYERAIQLNPNFALGYYNRALVYRDRGDWRNMLADLDRVLRLDPKDAFAYYNRGLAQSKLGNSRAAIPDLQQALRLAQSTGNTDLANKATALLRQLQP